MTRQIRRFLSSFCCSSSSLLCLSSLAVVLRRVIRLIRLTRFELMLLSRRFCSNILASTVFSKHHTGGPRGRVVKVADFSALDHSIISPMWVRASLGARVTCGTSQVLLAGVSGGFSPGTPVFAPPTD